MPPSDPPEKERRVFPRVPVSGRASIRLLGEVSSQIGRAINLSRSGVLLETSPLAVGTRVQVEFLGLDATGTVLRSVLGDDVTVSSWVAVQFDEIQDPDWRTIRLRRD